MSSSKNALDDLNMHYSALEIAAGGQFTSWQYSRVANLKGENQLNHEIGRYGPWDGERYNLTKEQEDLLAAQTRKEVAAVRSFSETLVAMMLNLRSSYRDLKYLAALLIVQNSFIIFLLLRS
jgi:hypothetical protein